jgi:hypothetical protein
LYLANLELRLRDPDVVTRVTDATGVDAGAYASGIQLARVGQSSSADFSFTATRPEVAAAVVETAMSAGLRSLAVEGLPFAKREIELAEKSYEAAVRDLNRFRRENSVAFPEEQYQQTVTELEATRTDAAEADASGDAAGLARATAVVEELSQTLGSLQRLLPEYEQLDDARMVALELRSAARDRLASKEAEIRLTSAENVRRDISTTQQSRARLIVQGALAAVAVSLFLMFALFVLPGLLWPRRRHRSWPKQ